MDNPEHPVHNTVIQQCVFSQKLLQKTTRKPSMRAFLEIQSIYSINMSVKVSHKSDNICAQH